jgi:hypothetical protein
MRLLKAVPIPAQETLLRTVAEKAVVEEGGRVLPNFKVTADRKLLLPALYHRATADSNSAVMLA